MTNYGIAFALVSGLVIGCGGDSGGDEAADTAGDTTGATASVTATETGDGTLPATMSETDTLTTVTVTASATETDATTAPSDSSGATTDGGDNSSGGDGSTTEAVVSASGTLEPKSGSTAMGSILFTDNGDGSVDLVVELTGVEPAGLHALHIHETPDCSAEDGTSTGNHWNPKGTMLGELGTVDIADDGTGMFTKTDAWSIGTGRVNDVVDHAIIIHADDGGGTRIACGVIALD